MKHGDVQNIYRIVNSGQADLDLTRAQALRVYWQLRKVLYPRAPQQPKRKTSRVGR